MRSRERRAHSPLWGGKVKPRLRVCRRRGACHFRGDFQFFGHFNALGARPERPAGDGCWNLRSAFQASDLAFVPNPSRWPGLSSGRPFGPASRPESSVVEALKWRNPRGQDMRHHKSAKLAFCCFFAASVPQSLLVRPPKGPAAARSCPGVGSDLLRSVCPHPPSPHERSPCPRSLKPAFPPSC